MLEATGELLAERGVSALTVEEVARRSGVAKSTLYRHFGGADGLVFTLVGSRVSAAESPDTGSLRGDLREIQRAYLEMFDEPLDRELFVWMLTKAMQSAQAATLFAAARIQPEGPTVVALRRAIARGEIPATTDIEMALHVIQGPLISRRVIGGARLTPQEEEQLLEMILAALVGREGEAGEGGAAPAGNAGPNTRS